MKSSHVVLIVLAVVAALFVLGVGLGAKDRDEGQAKHNPEAYAQNHDMPAWTEWLGGTFSAFTPKVKPQPDHCTLTAQVRTASLKLPAGEDAHRKASFTIKGSGAVSIVYEPPAQPPPDQADAPLCKQSWPTEKTKDPYQGSFIVLRGGGVLKITLKPGGARDTCTVEFQ